ncbi:MAG: hypothetical protein L0Z62_20650 [Gemmataceae bacterium]|nr:hypothetical protein [Gemmataceae bacterium]
MELQVAYLGRSTLRRAAGGLAVALAPNLRRDRVSFAGTLRHPLRFREAVSALHDVVISDLRYKPKDRSAYRAWLAEQKKREEELRQTAYQTTKKQIEAQKRVMLPRGLQSDFTRLRKVYWGARDKYNRYLSRHDPELWRYLMPCDPVITVAQDVLFFECFSADESSYGCLTVDRDAFTAEQDVALGTTNVDYSWALYDEFQKLRSYRRTDFTIDPAGFEVKTAQAEGYREEKIDLPSSWLRGFMQLQSAMSLPMQRVPVSREGLYDILAWLKRHKARTSPRAVRFELQPGQPVAVVLEPWERRIVLHGTAYEGPKAETIRTWGRDRLRVLARLMPLMDGADVYLLGTGLPSFWSVRMGEMRLILGLSGWTANDWTGGSALDQLAPPAEPSRDLVASIAGAFKQSPALTFEQVRKKVGAEAAQVAAGLNRLALLGQLIHDLPAGLYRWRRIMPFTLSLKQAGPDSPETAEAPKLVKAVKVARDEHTESGLRALTGKVENRSVELLIDLDGRIVRGKCTCSHHFQFGLRRGPCRHLQALRLAVLGAGPSRTSLAQWYRQLWTSRN